jgi:hypothetical protein
VLSHLLQRIFHQNLPAKNADEVRNLFGDEVSILEGELGGADKPTPIQNLITDEWIRN